MKKVNITDEELSIKFNSQKEYREIANILTEMGYEEDISWNRSISNCHPTGNEKVLAYTHEGKPVFGIFSIYEPSFINFDSKDDFLAYVNRNSVKISKKENAFEKLLFFYICLFILFISTFIACKMYNLI